ncbi:MAG TPA: hypothetical protein PL187_10270 [Caldilinea sp.]|nr:hypothetical protein [Caldilinea sp.]
MTTQNRYDTGLNYVVADQPPAPIDQTSLIRRNDVMQAVGGVIEAYRVQQSALLDSVTGETVQGRGFLSDAGQVAERRKTSRLYLLYYTFITGLVAAGLVLLAHGAGYLDAGGSFATWLALTGGLALLLGWKRHGDELVLTPESIALRVVDAHENVALYESETRRLAIEWEHSAEARRQAAQEKAAEYARQQAQLRIDELDARRKAIEAQRAQADPYEGRFRVVMGTEPEPSKGTELAPHVVSEGDSTPLDTRIGGHWRDSLLVWIATLYQPGIVTEAGVIRSMVPWSARSSWTEQDKAEARRIMCEMRPALIVHDGNRWRLRTEVVSDVEQALQLVRQRL